MKKLLLGVVALCPILAFAQPLITSISPTTGPIGTSVTISGSGFNTIAANNFVYFNDSVLASVTSASDTLLTVIVPTASSNGPIKVVNSALTDFSAQYYTYPALSVLPPPVISSFSPLMGEVGDIVTINGANFSAVPANNIVYFGSVRAQVISSTTTQISVYVPTGFKFDLISVTVNRLTGYSSKLFDVTFMAADPTFLNSSFSQGVSFADVGDRADSRNFADFDGDGKPDLASINYQWYSFLRNTSEFDDFSFAPAVNIPCLSAMPSWFILPVDVDGDGKMDVVANNASAFSVLKNTSTLGTISFRPIKNFPTSDLPKRSTSNDGPLFNGNSYYYGTSGYAPYDTLVDPMQISAGDLDGDGKPDLAVSFVQNGSNGFFGIYRNTTNNGIIDFSFSKKIEGTSEFTEIKDLDGDGKPEIIAVIYSPPSSKITIFRNISTPGNINFASGINLSLNLGIGVGTTGDSRIGVADINNDGKLDLVVPELYSNRFSVSLNQSSAGNLSFASPVYLPTLNYPLASLSDLDGDGKTDVAVCDQNGTSYISIYKNMTVGNIVSFDTVRRFSAPGNNFLGVKTCDIDMDGKLDLLSQNSGFNLYRNKANEPTIDSITVDSAAVDTSAMRMISGGGPHVMSNTTQEVVIKGDRFLGATSVTFDGVPAEEFTIDSKYQITAIVESTAAATMKVRVETPTGIATLPVGTMYAPLSNFCTSGSAKVIFKAGNGIPPYEFQYKVNNGAVTTVTSGAGDSVVVVKTSSTAASYTYTLINVTDKYGNGANNLINKTAVLNAVVTPPTPGVMTGPANACPYMGTTINATYTIAPVALANSFNWTVPAGATIVSGQGTTSVDVTYSSSFVSGNVAVQCVSGCVGAFRTKAISKTAPATPGAITGPTNACPYVGLSTNATYSIAAVANANSYAWTAPSGATIVSGQGTISVEVSYSPGYTTGSLTVQAISGCANSGLKSLTVTKTIPPTPGTVTGVTNACPYVGTSTNVTYSITAVANAISYNWTVPANATIISGQGTTSINVNFGSAYASGNISVQSVANCGSSTARTLAVVKTLPAVPAAITGPTNACAYMGSVTNATYSITAVSGATSYNWTVPTGATIASGQGTTSINVAYAGSFVSGNVSVQSVANCGSSAARTLAITKTIPAVPGTITGSSEVCFFVSSGTNANYSITPVSGAASYNWTVPSGVTITSGQGTTTISVSFAGNFTSGNVSVQSIAGCGNSALKSLALTNTLPAAPSSINGPSDACPYISSATNATYSITAVGGASSYNWLVPSGASIVSGQGTTSISVNYSGSFSGGNISVQSVSACGNSNAQSLMVVNSSLASLTSINGPTTICSNALNNVTYTVAPVNGAISYTWIIPSNVTIVSGQGTNTLVVNYSSNFTSGTLSVSASNSCSTSNLVTTLINKATINASISSQNVSCNGGSNGSATVSATGGTPTCTYNWSPSGGTAATMIGLAAGTYSCVVTDANGCTANQTVTITQPSAISASISSQSVSCNGGNNGLATVSVSGGTPTYTYSWSPAGGTASTATGLSAGNYTCTITDAGSCTTTQTASITQASVLSASVSSPTNVSCNGGSNGSATVSATGGTSTYTYNWSPSGGTAATATGLLAGTYSCVITDANGCTTTQTVTITQPSAISVSIVSQNVSCNGGSNGSATVSATGGTPTYTYSWAPTGGTASTATGLVAGTYSCVITDATGCTTTQTVTITQPTTISTSVSSQTNVSCNVGSNGSATVSVSGGTPTYTYSWSPSGGTAATAIGLAAGTYSCTITDANGCTTTQISTIAQPTAISASITSQNVSCNGGSNGSATVSVTGGTPTYTYSWSPSGGTAATAIGLAVGTYSCIITDANGCTAIQTVTISAPSALTALNSASPSSVCLGSSSILTASTSGGTGAVTYSWNTGAVTSSISVTPSATATYTVTATDASACVNTTTITVTVNTLPTISANASPATVNLGSSSSLTASGGVTYSWMPGSLSGTSVSVTPTTTTTYTVTGTSSLGCTNTSVTTVTVTVGVTQTQLKSIYCGTTVVGLTSSLACNAVSGATNYEYELTESGTGNVYLKQRGNSYNDFALSMVPQTSYGKTYSIRVRAYVGGLWGVFGNSCSITTPAFPLTQLKSTYCGTTVATLASALSCDAVTNATNYEYELTESGTGNVYVKQRGNSYNDFTFTMVPQVAYGKTYSIRVRAYVGGWGTFGNSCSVSTPAFPVTQIKAIYCGTTVAAKNSAFACDLVYGATNYEYELTESGTGNVYVKQRGNSYTDFFFSLVPQTQYGKTYSIRVRAYAGGVWGSFGSACSISMPATAKYTDPSQQTIVEETAEVVVNAYPNPTNGKLNLEASENILSISLYSISGAQLLKEDVATEVDLTGFENGPYILIIKTETTVKHLRILKQD